MTVSRDDLEAALTRLREDVTEPVGGLYGPGSVAWRINREAVLFLGGGRAALLQLAHPFVAHAVDQHSATRADVAGRFRRTFIEVYAMSFGTLDDAVASARRVHRIHSRIRGVISEDLGRFRRGSLYEANDEQSLRWVHATLVDTAVQVYERVVRPLRPEERDRYLAESNRFAALFGIPEHLLWDDWSSFQAYVHRMFDSDELVVGHAAASLGRFLTTPPSPAHRHLVEWYVIATAGLLPERFRQQFGLPFGRFERFVFDRSVAAIGSAYRNAPRRLRYVPAYVEAARRVRGHVGPDRFGRMLEQAVLRGLSNKKRGARPSGRPRPVAANQP